MANIKSAMKRDKQNKVARLRNRHFVSTLRGDIKKFRKLVAEGDIEGARKSLGSTYSRIDKSIQKGIIHRNRAARLKSRLTASLSRSSDS
ncbi:MAG TPA: 30S ribosomal protein S20 [Acidobacteriota bacterium]|nr:30S ribosomal protein S20 [Acidobacteriota bacterium]